MGRSERREALAMYVQALLLDGERKSMVPLASRLINDESQIEAVRQRMQGAVNVAEWDSNIVFQRVAKEATRQLAGVNAWVVDDTGFVKKGTHSAGVQRQYSGTLGRVDNCQVATSLHLASDEAGICIGMQLYLSPLWCDDAERRTKAAIPQAVEFRKKWQIALGQIDTAVQWGLEKRPVLADAGFGDCAEFRNELHQRGLHYVVGIAERTSVWPHPVPFEVPVVSPDTIGRKPSRPKPVDGSTPLLLQALAEQQGKPRTVVWSTKPTVKSGRFWATRIQTARRYRQGRPPGEEQWLLVQFKQGKPVKYWLSNLPADTSLKQLVYLAKLRWRIERDYQEMKGELGLDQYEGRGYRGFHHHVACVAAAHAFLSLQRALSPPQL